MKNSKNKWLKKNDDVFEKTHGMAKQKFRPTRPGDFSGAKAYVEYVEILKKHRNAVGRTFCDAINDDNYHKLPVKVYLLGSCC